MRRVLLTGAAGGVGAATRAALEARGARVVGLDRRPGEGVLAADLRDPGSVRRAVAEAVGELGGLDVLVNNAGVAGPSDAGADPDALALEIVEVNLLGTWRVTAAALPALTAARGRVVNVASGLAFANLPLAAAYCASKRALAAYSDVLRLEYAGVVGVTTVYPMYMKTGLHAPGERAGLFIDGLLREETVDDAARAIVRAAFGPLVRDMATTPMARVELAVARHLPALADRIVRWRVGRLASAGRFAGAELAAPMVARMRASV
jgi:NAD(P)-dependent dehydrogenase (short-subunit alcohol dehydrogenase family)